MLSIILEKSYQWLCVIEYSDDVLFISMNGEINYYDLILTAITFYCDTTKIEYFFIDVVIK